MKLILKIRSAAFKKHDLGPRKMKKSPLTAKFFEFKLFEVYRAHTVYINQ